MSTPKIGLPDGLQKIQYYYDRFHSYDNYASFQADIERTSLLRQVFCRSFHTRIQCSDLVFLTHYTERFRTDVPLMSSPWGIDCTVSLEVVAKFSNIICTLKKEMDFWYII